MNSFVDEQLLTGPDVPHGFFEFAREAASKNAKMLLSKVSKA